MGPSTGTQSLSRAHRLTPQNTDSPKSMHILEAKRFTLQDTDTAYSNRYSPQHRFLDQGLCPWHSDFLRHKDSPHSTQIFLNLPLAKPIAEVQRTNSLHITVTLTRAHRPYPTAQRPFPSLKTHLMAQRHSLEHTDPLQDTQLHCILHRRLPEHLDLPKNTDFSKEHSSWQLENPHRETHRLSHNKQAYSMIRKSSQKDTDCPDQANSTHKTQTRVAITSKHIDWFHCSHCCLETRYTQLCKEFHQSTQILLSIYSQKPLNTDSP